MPRPYIRYHGCMGNKTRRPHLDEKEPNEMESTLQRSR